MLGTSQEMGEMGALPSGAPAPSADHTAAIVETQRLAAYSGRTPGSADLLLGLLRVGGAGARLLFDRGVTPARLEAFLGETRSESPTSLRQLDVASHRIALNLSATQTTSLHLLLAILRTGGAGMDLLRIAGHEPTRLRTIVMRALTGPGRFGERSVHRGATPPPGHGAPSLQPMATPPAESGHPPPPPRKPARRPTPRQRSSIPPRWI